MLQHVSPAHFEAVAKHLESLNHHLAVGALLAGAVPGEVYADDPDKPGVVLAWTQQRLFLAGSPSRANVQAVGACLAEHIAPALLARGSQHLALYFTPESWIPELEVGLSAWRPQPALRQYFEFRQPRPGWRALLPAGFELRPVDRALLARPHLRHLDLLEEELRSERPSVDEFLDKSFGVCAVTGATLAGWCLSEYNHGSACEVGIETVPAYRGLRLGTVLASALAEQAIAAGYTRIGWHCYAHNTASVNTARAAGFEWVKDYGAVVLNLQALA
jgi:RimJ/RimL family protein N-acetyltransferase